MPSTTVIRTGIIGYGLSGRVFHAPFIETNPLFELTAIATGNADRQAEARANHPGASIVATPEELIALGLDLVILASPAHVHLSQGLAALEAGSAVVIDKPFVPTVLDAKKLIAKSEEVGRPLIVFQNRRWDGDFLTLSKLVRDGSLGTVHRFESTFERWGTPKPGQWQETTSVEQGAGITFDLGSHLIDQALHLFGPAVVEQAEMANVRGAASEDDSFISLLHTSGTRSHLTMSRAAGRSGPRFRALGDANSYMVYGLDNQEPFLKEKRWPGSEGYGVTPTDEWGTDNDGPVATENGDYPAFYAGVAASIIDGAPVPVDPKDSLEVVRIIERAHALAKA